MKSPTKQNFLALLLLLLLVLGLHNSFSTAFVPPPNTNRIIVLQSKNDASSSSSSRTLIQMSTSSSDKQEYLFSRARNEGKTDVRNLLTQRAIQSFIYLSHNVRDPHSANWIEEFLETTNQLEYHGTGAGYLERRFGGRWDAPLLEMMQQPPIVLEVSAKRRGKGQKGWSINNPYLEDKYFHYTVDIDPVSLVSRILSVREQIAKEWVADLDVLDAANEEILESYFRQIGSSSSSGTEQRQQRQQPQQPQQPQKQQPTTKNAFERVAVSILYSHTAFQETLSSPLRRANFDLLYNICTQASIHRILRRRHDHHNHYSSQTVDRLKSQDSHSHEDVTLLWLREFYSDRVADYFDGHQSYGQADEFMEELLTSSPRLIYTKAGKSAGLTDPLRVAELIIEERRSIVEEWKELMKNVPNEHANGIRRSLLDQKLIMPTTSESSTTTANDDTFVSSGGFE